MERALVTGGRKFSPEENKALRSHFDGDDLIMAGRGLEVKTPRILSTRRRPEESQEGAQFLYNDAGTSQFLLSVFPKLHTDPHQRTQAAVWGATIYAYFRQGWGDTRIERDFGWQRGSVGSIVQQIRRKIKGLRRNGKSYSIRKRGRPRKIKEQEAKAA